MKQNQLTTLRLLAATISILLLSACGLVETPGASDESREEAIAQAVHDYLGEQGSPFDQAEVKIEQSEGDFARVQIISTDPAQPGGFTGFLQRVDGDWMVLIAGSGYNPEEIQVLGIPESILPEGWDFSVDEPPGFARPDGCPQPDDKRLLWADETLGFCLLYPASHTVVQQESGNTEIVVSEVMNHIDPRISITSEDLAGQSLAQVVDDFLSGYEGFEIARSDMMVGGQEAVLLDGVPGQDYYRIVFVAHGGLLFKLSFAPYDPNLDNLAQAEQLYALAMGSFRFTTP